MCKIGHNHTIHLGFTEQEISTGTHICLIYNNDEERKKIIIKFLAAAGQDNEQVAFFVDQWDKEHIRSQLASEGVDVLSAEKSGQLAISDASDAYYPEGSFSAEEMWERIRNGYDACIEQGYRGLRGTGEMSWALKDVPGNEQLIKYEDGLNVEMLTRPFSVICQYDANLFSGAMLMEVLQVHPFMISNDRVVSNPHFQGKTA